MEERGCKKEKWIVVGVGKRGGMWDGGKDLFAWEWQDISETHVASIVGVRPATQDVLYLFLLNCWDQLVEIPLIFLMAP